MDNSQADLPHRVLRAERLKERIYLTFAALAVVLALQTHEHAVGAIEAIVTLAVTTAGLVLAVFAADIVSHLVVHERFMSRTELRHAVLTSFGATGAVGVPFVLLGISALTGWDVTAALWASSAALTVSLLLVGVIAVRKLPLTPLQRLVAVGAEAALGLLVIGLQVLAHG